MAEKTVTTAEHNHIGRTFHAGCPACEERRTQMAEAGRRRMDLEGRIAQLEETVDMLLKGRGVVASPPDLTALTVRMDRLKSEFDIHRNHHGEPYTPGRGTGR